MLPTQQTCRQTQVKKMRYRAQCKDANSLMRQTAAICGGVNSSWCAEQMAFSVHAALNVEKKT